MLEGRGSVPLRSRVICSTVHCAWQLRQCRGRTNTATHLRQLRRERRLGGGLALEARLQALLPRREHRHLAREAAHALLRRRQLLLQLLDLLLQGKPAQCGSMRARVSSSTQHPDSPLAHTLPQSPQPAHGYRIFNHSTSNPPRRTVSCASRFSNAARSSRSARVASLPVICASRSRCSADLRSSWEGDKSDEGGKRERVSEAALWRNAAGSRRDTTSCRPAPHHPP